MLRDWVPPPNFGTAAHVKGAHHAIQRIPPFVVDDGTADDHQILVDGRRRGNGDAPVPSIVQGVQVDLSPVAEVRAGSAGIPVQGQQEAVVRGLEHPLAAEPCRLGLGSGLPIGNAPAVVVAVHRLGPGLVEIELPKLRAAGGVQGHDIVVRGAEVQLAVGQNGCDLIVGAMRLR